MPFIFRCDLYMHMVDPDAYSVLPADQAIKRIDEQYDQLKELYEETGILDLVEFADASSKGRTFAGRLLSPN